MQSSWTQKDSGSKELHDFKSQLPGKIDLRTLAKHVSLSNLSIYVTWKAWINTEMEWQIQVARWFIYITRYS